MDGEYTDFTDKDSELMLELLHKYMMNYAPDLPQTIPALAWDLASAMDVTTDRADKIHTEIEANWL